MADACARVTARKFGCAPDSSSLFAQPPAAHRARCGGALPSSPRSHASSSAVVSDVELVDWAASESGPARRERGLCVVIRDPRDFEGPHRSGFLSHEEAPRLYREAVVLVGLVSQNHPPEVAREVELSLRQRNVESLETVDLEPKLEGVSLNMPLPPVDTHIKVEPYPRADMTVLLEGREHVYLHPPSAGCPLRRHPRVLLAPDVQHETPTRPHNAGSSVASRRRRRRSLGRRSWGNCGGGGGCREGASPAPRGRRHHVLRTLPQHLTETPGCEKR
mmetsp:Transcript_17075/g.32389  ORF Transcript_17075/g.32389 Transcript_17075/m.32389 type:complete len:276 (-) Transcript_17075:233-1060(-)